jgi:hypothetical protein
MIGAREFTSDILSCALRANIAPWAMLFTKLPGAEVIQGRIVYGAKDVILNIMRQHDGLSR